MNTSSDNNVEEWIEALKNGSWSVRSAAAWNLGISGDQRAIKPLIGLLEDECARVRHNVAWALSRLSDQTAVPALIKALKDDYEMVRLNAADSLGRIGDGAAILPLIVILIDDQVERVREAAAESLHAIGNEHVCQVLWELVESRRSGGLSGVLSARNGMEGQQAG